MPFSGGSRPGKAALVPGAAFSNEDRPRGVFSREVVASRKTYKRSPVACNWLTIFKYGLSWLSNLPKSCNGAAPVGQRSGGRPRKRHDLKTAGAPPRQPFIHPPNGPERRSPSHA